MMLERKRLFKTVDKVTALVTSESQQASRLLVIQHPYAGLQVPAGTVNLGEDAQTAVFREVSEESGLTELRLVKELATDLMTCAEPERVVLRMTKIFDEPSYDASSSGYALTRGSIVRMVNKIGMFAEIEADPLDTSQSPAERPVNVRGFVRNSLLGLNVRRHIYHLVAQEETEDSWLHFADGNNFQVFWTRMDATIDLVPEQHQWLVRYLPELTKN